MKFFVDTADVEEVRQAIELGVLDGVTTNPSHVAKSKRDPKDLYAEICEMVDGPVSLEAVSTETDAILAEGRELAKVADNAVVKVPITVEGMRAVRIFSEEGIKTNITTTFSAVQALIAAKCGASYVSPFIGRLDDIGHEGMGVIAEIREIFDNYGYTTEILVASTRHPLHIRDAARLGADVCTMPFDTLKKLFKHPLTDIGIQKFLDDWKTLGLD